MALGEACGLQSRLTSLPERALSTRLKGFWEKLGAEAVGDREIWSSDSHSMESVMNSNWRSNSLWQKKEESLFEKSKGLNKQSRPFPLAASRPFAFNWTYILLCLSVLYLQKTPFIWHWPRTDNTDQCVEIKWINFRINIGEIWVLQWSTKSHGCFQCCLVIWAWAVTTQSFIIQMKDGEQAVETQRSYQAPSVRRWNKWCRACSPPHTDTSRHLRGLVRRWREHRSLFALGPVDKNTNNRSKMVAMWLLGHCWVAWFHGCLLAQVKRDYCQFSMIFWSLDMVWVSPSKQGYYR